MFGACVVNFNVANPQFGQSGTHAQFWPKSGFAPCGIVVIAFNEENQYFGFKALQVYLEVLLKFLMQFKSFG